MKSRSITTAKNFLSHQFIRTNRNLSTQTNQTSTSLKLIALPLSRGIPSSSTAPLFYLHAKRIPLESLKDSNGQSISIPLSKKVLNYAASQWLKLGDGRYLSYYRLQYYSELTIILLLYS